MHLSFLNNEALAVVELKCVLNRFAQIKIQYHVRRKRKMQNRLFDIQEAVAESSDELIALRRDFHAHPELGLQEYRTAQNHRLLIES